MEMEPKKYPPVGRREAIRCGEVSSGDVEGVFAQTVLRGEAVSRLLLEKGDES